MITRINTCIYATMILRKKNLNEQQYNVRQYFVGRRFFDQKAYFTLYEPRSTYIRCNTGIV